MDATEDIQRAIALRPIPFLDRAESAYEQIRESMFTSSEEATRDNVAALRTMLARSEAVIDSREATLRDLGANDGQRIPGGA